jgi:hypothetical protein
MLEVQKYIVKNDFKYGTTGRLYKKGDTFESAERPVGLIRINCLEAEPVRDAPKVLKKEQVQKKKTLTPKVKAEDFKFDNPAGSEDEANTSPESPGGGDRNVLPPGRRATKKNAKTKGRKKDEAKKKHAGVNPDLTPE